jgi:signal transduction histidine kinase
MTLTIRARLTFWYTALVAVLLVCFGLGVLAVQSRISRAQFDEELDGVNRTVASVLQAELDETHDLRRAALETRKSVDLPGRAIAVLDGGGQPVGARWRGFRRSSLPPFTGSSWRGTVDDGGRLWRVHVTRVPQAQPPYQIVSAGSLDQLAREQRLLAVTLLVSMPFAVMLSGGVCWWAASRALQPVTAMAAQAEAITGQSTDVALSVHSAADEVGQLAGAFNKLLERLRTALLTQRQFMANASHELRTPISVARTAAEVTLSASQSREADYREALEIVEAQTSRLGRMVDDMLTLASADAGGVSLHASTVYLDELAADCVKSLTLLADQRGVRLELRTDEDLLACADDVLIRQLLTNLVDNGVKHTPPGGFVATVIVANGTSATITISDNGPGIAACDRERVFERFTRLDPARDSRSGAGLGLPIARWIAHAHGGTLTLGPSEWGGCEFVVRLPVLVPAVAQAERPPGPMPQHARAV